MQKIKVLLPLCFGLISFFSSQAQVSNADTIVHKLFATLPANDEKAFVALYPSPQQLIELVKNIIASDEVKQQIAMSGQKVNMDSIIQVQVAAMSKPEMMAEMTKGFGRNFQQAVERGKAKNIDWKKARFVSYTLDTAATGNDEAMLQKLGYKTMNGVIDFTVDTASYQMQFSKILFLPKEQAWYGGEFGQIVRKGEKFTPDNVETKDVEISTTPDEPAPPPPPAKSKTKTKNGSVKTKSVTKPATKKSTTKS